MSDGARPTRTAPCCIRSHHLYENAEYRKVVTESQVYLDRVDGAARGIDKAMGHAMLATDCGRPARRRKPGATSRKPHWSTSTTASAASRGLIRSPAHGRAWDEEGCPDELQPGVPRARPLKSRLWPRQAAAGPSRGTSPARSRLAGLAAGGRSASPALEQALGSQRRVGLGGAS